MPPPLRYSCESRNPLPLRHSRESRNPLPLKGRWKTRYLEITLRLSIDITRQR
jgi:hypothetical protein